MNATAVLPVLLEDDDVLVVDKPGGLVCHSASRPELGSLVGMIREHWLHDVGRFCEAAQGGADSQSRPTTETAPVRMINRLDRETSGIVIVAKTERAGKNLGKQVLRREIQKEYTAIVCGAIQSDSGVIDQPIGITKDGVVFTKRVIDPAGKPSVTEFSVAERLAGFTVMTLRPQTGRAHQLRVHLAWLGHPIIGDKIYGPDERLYLEFIEKGVTDEMLGKLLLPRHALHADKVTFRHPTTQLPVTVTAELPADMTRFIEEHR